MVGICLRLEVNQLYYCRLLNWKLSGSLLDKIDFLFLQIYFRVVRLVNETLCYLNF